MTVGNFFFRITNNVLVRNDKSEIIYIRIRISSGIECPVYDTKQSDDEALVMRKLWECGVSLYWHRSQLYTVLEC